jgi:hypothetical protein
MVARRSLLVWVLAMGGFDVEDLGGVEAVVVEAAPLDGDGKQDWVGVGFARYVGLLVVLLGVVSVRDDPLVVGWLGSGHSILGGLSLRTIPCWMRAVLVVKQAIESSRLLGPSSTSSSCVVAATLRGVFLTACGLFCWVLIGYGVNLLLVAIVPARV